MTPKRNPIAASLRSDHLRPKIVRPKKGRGSYSRKGRGSAPLSQQEDHRDNMRWIIMGS